MRDAIFSEVLLLDEPADSRVPTKGRTRKRGQFVDIQAALTKAFTAAMADNLVNMNSEFVAHAAAAMAEIALGRSVALRLNPKLADDRRDAARLFLEKVIQVTEGLETSRIETAIAKLAEVILPDDLGGARAAIADDNLTLRDRFIAEIPCLSSVEVGKHAGHKASNAYATAARWKKAGDVFSVNHRGSEYFPGFQFREGRPHPTIKQALASLPDSLSPWQRAFWFVSTNGWLSGKTPAESLDEADAVISAAKREREEVVG